MSDNTTTCYDKDGRIFNWIPCGLSSISTCCAAGWDCLSNGLCRQQGTTNNYGQGTCSDPTYQNCLSICNQPQFQGYLEVSRCDANGNNWCCAGKHEGESKCCSTNLTTALEPYPFVAVNRLGQSSSELSVATPVMLPRTTLTPGFSSSSSMSISAPSSSSMPTTSQSSMTGIPPTTFTTASSQPASQTPSSTLGLELGVPLAATIILLGIFVVFVFRRNRKQKRDLAQLQGKQAGNQVDVHELGGNGRLAELDVTRWELTEVDAGMS